MKNNLFKICTVIVLAVVMTLSFGCAKGNLGWDMDVGCEYMTGIKDGTAPGESGNDNVISAGSMTAGCNDDNQNYDSWKQLFWQGQTEETNGKFYKYLGDDGWGLNSFNRVKVNVNCNGNLVPNAEVVFYDNNNNIIYNAVSGSDGVAYVFGNTDGGVIKVTSGDYTNEVAVSKDDLEVSVSLDGSLDKGNVIELMFVVDVTGSMGDELSYLQTEIRNVIDTVAKDCNGAKIYLALLFYRDHTDSEVFAYSDFKDVTENENLVLQHNFLGKQSATGGGDYEEAVDEALQLAISKQWSLNSTKIIFHVLDAPPHSGEEYQTRYLNAVLEGAKKGIRICPVLSSGANTLTEYLTRQTAIMTGGTFVFITDHSGLGDTHYNPQIPNVVIEKLNLLMIRLIKGYYNGVFERPVSWDGNDYYELTIVDNQDIQVISAITNRFPKDYTVKIAIKLINEDDLVTMYVDGEVVEKDIALDDEQDYTTFTFKMPPKDVTITFVVEKAE